VPRRDPYRWRRGGSLMQLSRSARFVPRALARHGAMVIAPVLLAWLMISGGGLVTAQSGPVVFDSNLSVRTVVSNLNQPVTMAFLGANDLLITEKATGQVKRVVNGSVAATALDLAVNNNSERGLLGIALHPDFPTSQIRPTRRCRGSSCCR